MEPDQITATANLFLNAVALSPALQTKLAALATSTNLATDTTALVNQTTPTDAGDLTADDYTTLHDVFEAAYPSQPTIVQAALDDAGMHG